MAQIIKQMRKKGPPVCRLRVFLGFDTDGKMLLHNETHSTKREAQKRAGEVLAEYDKGRLAVGGRKCTVGRLLDALLLNFQANKKTPWGRIVVEAHLRPFFAPLRADKVDTAAIQRYISSRLDQGVQSGTVNRELGLLRRAYRLGLETDPPRVGRVPKIPKLAENAPRAGFFEHEQYTAMREALPHEIRPILVFGYFTGCRKGEVLGLQWAQVDLLEGVVRLEPGTTKNDEARIIPLAPELYEVLVMQKATRDQYWPACPWVFFRLGERIKDFRGAWEAACRQAGLWEGDPKTGHTTKLFHDLRRTGVRNLVRAAVSERVAMTISGHKSRSVFDRYNIVSERDLKDAARRLGEYVATKEEAAQRIPTQESEHPTVQ